MTIPLLLLLFVLASALFIYHHKKTSISIFILALILLLTIGCGLIPYFLLNTLQNNYLPITQPVWGKQNAIIVLGTGTVKAAGTNLVIPTIFSFGRIYEGARLYSSCKKSNGGCTLIISGGDPLANGVSEASTYRNALVNTGINSEDIKIEPNSRNTFQNAKFTSVILKQEPYDRMYLVTSGFHLKRSILYFSYFGINPSPAPSDTLIVNNYLIPCGYNFAIADIIIHEYLEIARFYIYNYFGWNKK
jgi:uncharacterized SAM-binding protein YcdF (DUF218 family)